MQGRRWTLLSAAFSATLSLHCHRAEAPSGADPSAPLTAQQRVAALKNEIAQTPRLAKLTEATDRAAEIRTAVLRPWSRAWAAKDAAAFQRVLVPAAVLPAWSSAPRKLSRELDGLREYAWSPKPSASDETAAYLSGFSKIESVELEIASFDATDKVATLGLHYDLRGTIGSVRRNDRGLITAELVNTAGHWQLARVTPVSLESIETAPNRRPAFEDATVAMGLDNIPVTERNEAIRRGGYALATSDFDGDGKPDLLIGNYGPVKLFRNTGHGFEDVTASSGLRGETLVKSAAFADLDNDGLQDLVLVRFVDNPQIKPDHWMPDVEVAQADVVLYRNLGNGKFEYKGGDLLVRQNHFDRAMPIAVADFDGNGTLDIYIGFPGARDFTNDLHKDAKEAYSLGLKKQGLWLNDGKWGFKEFQGWEASADPETANPFPHSALVADLDNDGRPELVVVDDSGGASPVYQMGRDGKFHDVTARMGLKVPGWQMAASAADYDGDGLNDLVMTRVSIAEQEWVPGYRAKADPGYQPSDRERDLRQAQGLTLFRNTGDGKFKEVSAQAGLAYAGRGLAGAEWVDYNNDGLLDLYVANGLWTAGEEDAGGLLANLAALRVERDPGKTDAAMSRPGVKGESPNPMLGILREFKGTLANPTGPAISDKPTLSLAGSQRNRLFRNNGDGTFTEVGFLENADRVEDGYVAAVADFDNDGHPDLVLRNADPAPGVHYPPVVLLHNRLDSAPSVVVTLAGTKDNANAIGAQLTGWVGGHRLFREIHGVSGATQSDSVAFFGLGLASRMDKLEVRWPSGRIEQYGPMSAGRVVLKEGAGREIRASLETKAPEIGN